MSESIHISSSKPSAIDSDASRLRDVDLREAVETADDIALSLQLPQRVLAMRLDVAACWHQNHAPRVVHPCLPLKPLKRGSRADHRMPTPARAPPSGPRETSSRRDPELRGRQCPRERTYLRDSVQGSPYDRPEIVVLVQRKGDKRRHLPCYAAAFLSFTCSDTRTEDRRGCEGLSEPALSTCKNGRFSEVFCDLAPSSVVLGHGFSQKARVFDGFPC